MVLDMSSVIMFCYFGMLFEIKTQVAWKKFDERYRPKLTGVTHFMGVAFKALIMTVIMSIFLLGLQ